MIWVSIMLPTMTNKLFSQVITMKPWMYFNVLTHTDASLANGSLFILAPQYF